MKADQIPNNGFEIIGPTLKIALVVTALPVEFAAVSEQLHERQERKDDSGTAYEMGKLDDWVVWLVQIGAGNPNAAAFVERALHFIKPTPAVALFIGVAGGIKDVGLGDVVVSSKVCGYECGKDTDGAFLPRTQVFQPGHRIFQHATAVARKFSVCKVFLGPIAAGEKVVAGNRSSTFQYLRQYCSDCLAVEMESLGFLSALHAHPEVQGLVIRGISDRLGDKAECDAKGSQQIASQHAAAFAVEVLTGFVPVNHNRAFAETWEDEPLGIEPINFAPEFASVSGEMERPWLLEEVDRCLATRGKKHLALVGESGTGKTWAAITIGRTCPKTVALYLCTRHNRESLQAGDFVLKVAYELRDRLVGYKVDIPRMARLARTDPARGFRKLVVEPLCSIQPVPETALFVVDGLDESLHDGDADPRAGSIADLLLSHYNQLPAWLHLLVTARPSPVITPDLRSFDRILLNKSNAAHLVDIRQFIKNRMKPCAFLPGDLERNAAALARRAGASFQLANKLASNPYATETTELGLFFAEDFATGFPDKILPTNVRNVLEMLVAAREQLSIGIMADGQSACVADVNSSLQRLHRNVTAVDVHGETYYVPAGGLIDWLTNEEAAKWCFVNHRGGHSLLADACLRGQRSQKYGLRHCAKHLIEAERYDEAAIWLCDIETIHARCVAGLLDDHLGDCSRALAVVRAENLKNLLEAWQSFLYGHADFLADQRVALLQQALDCPDGHPVKEAAVAARNKLLVSISVLVHHWRRCESALVRRLPVSGGATTAGAANGSILVTGETNGKLTGWDGNTGKKQNDVTLHDDLGAVTRVTALDVSADGSVAVAANGRGEVFVWEPKSGHFRGQFQGHLLYCIADINFTNNVQIQAFDDGAFRLIWTDASDQRDWRFGRPSEEWRMVSSVEGELDGAAPVSLIPEKDALWKFLDTHEIETIEGATSDVFSERWRCTSYIDGHFNIVNFEQKTKCSINPGIGLITSIGLNELSGNIVITSADGIVKQFHVEGGDEIPVQFSLTHPSKISLVAPNGLVCVCSDGKSHFTVIDLREGKITEIAHSERQEWKREVFDLAVSADGRRAVTCERGLYVEPDDRTRTYVWNLESMTLERKLFDWACSGPVAISPDGQNVALASCKDMSIWNVNTGTCEARRTIKDFLKYWPSALAVDWRRSDMFVCTTTGWVVHWAWKAGGTSETEEFDGAAEAIALDDDPTKLFVYGGEEVSVLDRETLRRIERRERSFGQSYASRSIRLLPRAGLGISTAEDGAVVWRLTGEDKSAPLGWTPAKIAAGPQGTFVVQRRDYHSWGNPAETQLWVASTQQPGRIGPVNLPWHMPSKNKGEHLFEVTDDRNRLRVAYPDGRVFEFPLEQRVKHWLKSGQIRALKWRGPNLWWMLTPILVTTAAALTVISLWPGDLQSSIALGCQFTISIGSLLWSLRLRKGKGFKGLIRDVIHFIPKGGYGRRQFQERRQGKNPKYRKAVPLPRCLLTMDHGCAIWELEEDWLIDDLESGAEPYIAHPVSHSPHDSWRRPAVARGGTSYFPRRWIERASPNHGILEGVFAGNGSSFLSIAALSVDGQLAVIVEPGPRERGIFLAKMEKGELWKRSEILVGAEGSKVIAEFVRDGNILLAAAGETIEVWHTVQRAKIGVLKGHTGAVKAISWNPRHGTIVASVAADHMLCIWNLDSRDLLATFRLSGQGECCTVGDNGEIAVGVSTGDLLVVRYNVMVDKISSNFGAPEPS